MNQSESYETLENAMGYRFRNRDLLQTALTHSSYCNESKEPVEDNERLEFLGDAVVNLVIASEAYALESKWDEGRLTRLKALVVCGSTLAERGRALGLGSMLRLGKGAAREDRIGNTPGVLGDAFEAVTGAVFLDGGFDRAREFVLSQLKPVLLECHERGRMTDAKSALQAWCLKVSHKTPDYQVQSTDRPTPLFLRSWLPCPTARAFSPTAGQERTPSSRPRSPP
ncbi:MAG: ribonuclease III [Deltaproteobacteria bacterium]|nr:ribonuclease III [Deltaproteobacteria bacterium]